MLNHSFQVLVSKILLDTVMRITRIMKKLVSNSEKEYFSPDRKVAPPKMERAYVSFGSTKR